MLAAQAAVALANVRFAEGSSARSPNARAELEQRAGELTIINSIQQGIAAELDFQAIVDLVGDKLREVLKQRRHRHHAGIDQATRPIQRTSTRSSTASGFTVPPNRRARADRSSTMIATRARRGPEHGRQRGAAVAVPGTDQAQVERCRPDHRQRPRAGHLTMENHEREHAFGESEIRLLTDVAAIMGVALENARLFDETQRLLKETEQRAAELAVINSIQQGMAAELNFQGIVDLVGDKLREVLRTRRHRHPPGSTRRPDMVHLPVHVRARPAAARAARACRRPAARPTRMRETRAPVVF